MKLRLAAAVLVLVVVVSAVSAWRVSRRDRNKSGIEKYKFRKNVIDKIHDINRRFIESVRSHRSEVNKLRSELHLTKHSRPLVQGKIVSNVKSNANSHSVPKLPITKTTTSGKEVEVYRRMRSDGGKVDIVVPPESKYAIPESIVVDIDDDLISIHEIPVVEIMDDGSVREIPEMATVPGEEQIIDDFIIDTKSLESNLDMKEYKSSDFSDVVTYGEFRDASRLYKNELRVDNVPPRSRRVIPIEEDTVPRENNRTGCSTVSYPVSDSRGNVEPCGTEFQSTLMNDPGSLSNPPYVYEKPISGVMIGKPDASKNYVW